MDHTNKEKIKTSNIVAILGIIYCFSVPVLLLFFEIPMHNKDMFNFLSGAIVTSVLNGIVYYLFGYRSVKNTKTPQ